MATFKKTAERIVMGARGIGDIATMNQAPVSGEIDLHMTGGTSSVLPARADGSANLRALTPLKGPIIGKGGNSWIDVTPAVNTPPGVHRWPQNS